jgi:hypothetical protein
MSNDSASEPIAAVDGSRFITEKVAEEGGVLSGSTGGSPASKHSSTGGGVGGVGVGGDTPQTTATSKGGVPDGNCSPGAAPQKGKGMHMVVLSEICVYFVERDRTVLPLLHAHLRPPFEPSGPNESSGLSCILSA